jgi:hypothetical protein
MDDVDHGLDRERQQLDAAGLGVEGLVGVAEEGGIIVGLEPAKARPSSR